MFIKLDRNFYKTKDVLDEIFSMCKSQRQSVALLCVGDHQLHAYTQRMQCDEIGH